MNYIKLIAIYFLLCFPFISGLNSQNTFSDSSMVYIKGGTFYIGSKIGYNDEKNGKQIVISEFFMDKYEITNWQYCKFLNLTGLDSEKLKLFIKLYEEKVKNLSKIYLENDSFYVKPGFEDFPVNFVSWFGANAFCEFYGLRLPTEAEWEFAAKSKKHSIFNRYKTYSGSNKINDVAWYKFNSDNKVHQIGLKQANKFGLYDLSGNVDEWCSDWYLFDYYANAGYENPKGPEIADFKVYRGGSWYNSEKMLRVTNRRAVNPKSQKATIGFRVVKEVGVFCPIKKENLSE